MKVEGHTITISNEDKVFFPESGISKKDLIAYYADVSELILPYLRNRPVMVRRFPDGIGADGFYQKSVSDYFPEWTGSIQVEKEGGEIDHIICNDKASLLYLVNQGTVTFHNWLSTIEKLRFPDQMIIDLDPPKGDFEIVRKGAFLIKEFLDQIEITSFVQTTGSQGLHVFVPLDGRSDFKVVRSVVKTLGEQMCTTAADTFTMARRKDKREGRLFFDLHAMAYGQTSVTPYSIRPLHNAPIATPLDWEELKSTSMGPQFYRLKNIRRRLAQKENPWKGMRRHAISVSTLEERMPALS